MRTTYVSYLIFIMLTLLSVGCTDHIETIQLIDDEPQTNLKLRIAMSSAFPSTRAVDTGNPTGGETGDGLRLGQYNENNIYQVYLYQYTSSRGIVADAGTPVKLLASEHNVNFRPTAADVRPDGSIVKEIELQTNHYRYNADDHFIAVVNTGLSTDVKTLGQLRDELIAVPVHAASSIQDYDGFVMSNCGESEKVGGIGQESDPYVIQIPVERVTARIDFAYSSSTQAAGRFDIASGDNGYYEYAVEGKADRVRLSHVRITNGMQHPSYLIKRLAVDESSVPSYLADERKPATSYVVEPTTWQKNPSSINAMDEESREDLFNFWFGDSRYTNAVANYNSLSTPWFRSADKIANHTKTGDAFTDGTSLDEEDLDWRYFVLGYVNENTMKAENTLHNYTTGLVLKATYQPETVYKMEGGIAVADGSYSVGSTFWRYHRVDTNEDRYFKTQADAEAFAATLPSVPYVLFPYENAQCYYNVWLRHENIINDPTTTMMEFGIVRNNIYRVCVEFTGIGMPDVPDDMHTPENIRMYIFVRKWNLINHPTIEI